MSFSRGSGSGRLQPMSGVVVSTSGLTTDERDRIHGMVIALGGNVSKDFTSQVTHLVCVRAACGTKYRVATRIGRPIMSTSWVTDAHDRFVRGNTSFSARDDDFVAQHLLATFAGLRVSVTGMPLDNRKRIEGVLHEHGGTYAGDLTAECTHLIAEKRGGDKYDFAAQNGILVVRPAWLYDSQAARACLDEALYSLDTAVAANALLLPTPATAPAAAQPPDRSRPHPPTRGYSLLSEVAADTSDGDTGAAVAGEYFAPCTIYLSGIVGERLQRLRRVVREGLGTRTDALGPGVTHVVVGGKDERDLAALRALSSRPHIVSPRWLVECGRSGALLAEAPFRVWDKGMPDWAKPDAHVPATQPPTNAGPVKATMQPLAIISGPRTGASMSVDRLPSFSGTAPSGKSASSVGAGTGTGTEKSEPIFGGLEFRCLGVKEADATRFSRAVLKRGGLFSPRNALTWSVPRECRYVIVPLEYRPEIATSAEITNACAVTPIWLRECLVRGAMLERSLKPTFVPCLRPPPAAGMDEVSLSITNFDADEKDSIAALAAALGCTLTDRFTRKNTHLVCASPSGPKYESAIEWDIPVATIDWLYACAREWSLQPVDAFTPHGHVPGGTVRAACTTSAPATSSRGAAAEAASTNGGGRSARGDKDAFRPAFETAEAMSALATPGAKGKGKAPAVQVAAGSETPGGLGAMLQDTLKRAVKRSRAARDGDEEETDADEPPSKKAAQDAGVTATANDAHDGDEGPSPPRPLEGISVHVSTNLKEHRDLCVLVCALGGTTAPSIDSASHLVARGRASAPSREVKAAKTQRKKIVAPEWLYECERSGNVPSEALFPHTLNPKMALGLSVQSSSVPPGDAGAGDVDDADFVPSVSPAKPPAPQQADEPANNAHDTGRKTVEQLERLLEATRTAAGARRRSRRSASGGLVGGGGHAQGAAATDANEGNPSSAASVGLSPTGGNGSVLLSPTMAALGSPTDRVDEKDRKETVTYDDPVMRSERRRARVTRTNSGGKGADEEGAEKENTPKLPRRTPRKAADAGAAAAAPTSPVIGSTGKRKGGQAGGAAHAPAAVDQGSVSATRAEAPRFLLSALTSDMKSVCATIIRNLGGVILEQAHFTRDCTHLIVGTPSRAEKYLAACATGKWVLRTSFITACRQAGRFVDELAHEWSPQNVTDPSQADLVAAPRKWRMRIAASPSPRYAFDGWRVLLAVAPEKHAGFHSLLTEGGAVVLRDTSAAGGSPTHAFIDASYEASSTMDISGLANRGVLCLRPEYIAEFILLGREPNVRTFLVGPSAVTAGVFSAADGRFRERRGAAAAAAVDGEEAEVTEARGRKRANPDPAPPSTVRAKRRR